MIGDTAYGNVEVREQLEQRAIGVLAPLHLTGADNEKTLHKDRFAIDLDTRPSPARRARRHRSTSPPSRPAADGPASHAFTAATASPARCANAALPAANARSASAAAKTSARPRSPSSPTPSSALTSNAPDHASSACSD